jgi:hypothetical protein
MLLMARNGSRSCSAYDREALLPCMRHAAYYPRTGKYGGGRHWYCTECKRKIEKPTYREKQAEPALSGLPRRLEELDPEEVFG